MAWVRFDSDYLYRGAGFSIAFKAGSEPLNVIRAAAEAAIAIGAGVEVEPVPRAAPPTEATDG